jgi:hypothetical protein
MELGWFWILAESNLELKFDKRVINWLPVEYLRENNEGEWL